MNKLRKQIIGFFSIFLTMLIVPCSAYPADESVLFTSVAPDALILLDLSGSMRWTPAGGYMYISSSQSCGADVAYYPTSGSGHTKSCYIDPYGTVPKWGNTSCSGPFYISSRSGYSTDCSRLAIAKRAIFDMLDENGDGLIKSSGSSTDDSNLNIRMGYMRFYNCGTDDTGGSYTSGCNSLIREINSKYSLIYCGSSNSCSLTSTGSNCVNAESASGGTPLASALQEAKLYLDAHKASDPARACREKFVIFITDGADTFACGGNGSENQSDQYKRRKATVAKAKALNDAGYKVFMIGFGADMPEHLERTLNWAAYFGGTDNPVEANSGNTNAITVSSNPCNEDAANDPANAPLSGYAFLATNPDELTTALRQAVNMIRSATYSFTNISVSTARTTSENDMYVAYMQPIDDEPFWIGRLKKYAITASGAIGSEVWDAGVKLQARSASSRVMKTYINGSVVDFNTSNITPSLLGLGSSETTRRDEVVGYFRGETAYNEDNWKLGDIWHSSPVVITSPSAYFEDNLDGNNAFATFRASHQRTSSAGTRIVVVGANDGQFHFFETGGGEEIMSFIPPNLLHKLPLVAHSTHPTGLTHQYFVDGPISAADVWLGSGSGASKSASDWKTLVVFGLGRGAEIGAPNLWSKNSSCTPDTSSANKGYSQTYSTNTPYYCGYYAFDVTTTTSPTFKWRLNPTSRQEYFGAPWSKMAIGRVKISGNERWVGFIGGGGYSYECGGGQPSPPTSTWGKGFFVVDLKDGSIIWSYTKADNSEMNYSIPAPPGIVDTDGDGFIDTAYVGDMGGNMWRFKFCLGNQSSCNTSNWAGGYLYKQSTGMIRPIYTGVTITKDPLGNLWVYWGSGDKQCPADPNAQERFYAVKDDRISVFTFGDLENLTSENQTYNGRKSGFSIQIPGNGEKILSEPIVFGGVVYFTTFTPASGSNPCEQGGSGKLYGINYLTGGGGLSGGVRSTGSLGAGIPSSPIITINPSTGQPDLYVTMSGGGGVDSGIVKPSAVSMNLPSNKSKMLFWKDQRVK